MVNGIDETIKDEGEHEVASNVKFILTLKNYSISDLNGLGITKTVSCDRCLRTFSLRGNLNYHLKYQCDQKPRFKCPYCDYSSKHASNLRNQHMKKHHPDKKQYIIDLAVDADKA